MVYIFYNKNKKNVNNFNQPRKLIDSVGLNVGRYNVD